MAKGYVYILTNPSFRKEWVKIGKTVNVKRRMRQLFNTSLPLPFECYATLQTENYGPAEKLIHGMLDSLTKKRISPNREYFNIDPGKALEILQKAAIAFPDAVVKVNGTHENDSHHLEKKSAKKSGSDILLKKSGSDAEIRLFTLKGTKCKAKAIITATGETTVCAGSEAYHTPSKSMISYHALRDQLWSDGTIKNGVFTKDYTFSKTSAAASVIMATPMQGPTAWIDENGRTWDEIFRKA